MRHLLLGLGTASALLLALETVPAAHAAPTLAPKTPLASSDVVEVTHRHHRRHRWHHRRHHYHGFHHRHGWGYYNGWRGYRRWRRGYRHYNGWWFPPAAFGLNVIIRSGPRRRVLSPAHLRWCESRYRSYRASDNTFQPYHGPRKPCVSPYM